MAKVNPVKVKQDADKEEKAGRLERAVQLYRQLLDDNPRDWNTINKIGDLYARMNRMQEAASEYAKVADFYAKDGFHLKAIAIWKKINKLDASALDPYLKLADLYAKQGLMMEAKSQYQIVVDEYVKRGRTKDAGEVLRRLAEIDPGDLKLRSKLADLYTREGQTAKAIDEMVAIAEELNRKGHLAEAVQVLEKGLKIDASSAKLRAELARAYVVQKSFAKAAEILEEILRGTPGDQQALAQLGEAYLAANRVDDAERAFKQLIQLNPDNPDTRVQVARLLLAQGKLDAAYDELVPVVDRLVDRREAEKAAALLQQIVQRSPGHVKTLVKLVDVYRQLKNDRAVSGVYSQLTESYIKSGELDQAASILEILISMEPANQQHQTKLDFIRGKMGARPAAPVASPAPGPALEIEAGFEEDSITAPVMQAVPPTIVPSGPLSEEDKEFIEEHLAEGKVFRKYGLIDKAADQFEAVIARFSDHLETRLELLDVLKEKELLGKAAEQALAIAQIHSLRGDEEAAAAAFEEARQLAPEMVPAELPAPPAEEPLTAEPEAAALEAEEAVLAPMDDELQAAESEEDIPIEVEEGGAFDAIDETLPADDLGLEAVADTEPAPVEITDTNLALEESRTAPMAAVTDEALSFEAEELPLEAAPPAAEAEPPAAGTDLAPAPEEPVELEVPAPPQASVAKQPTLAGPAAVPADLQKVLDEVESYVSLGFVDDAREALREIAQKYLGHPAIVDKAAELGLDLREEPAAPAPPLAALEEIAPPAASPDLGVELSAPAAPGPSELEQLGELAASASALPEPVPFEPAAPPQDTAPVFESPVIPEGGIDLGAELGELFSAQSVEEAAPEQVSTELGDAGLAEIFKEFKKGVDKQLGKEDYDTRYNLGIAYKEMGLIDEAISEFQLAAKDEQRLLECSSMLGICFMEKGMPKLAVKWFEKGLNAPGRSNEEYQGLRYDLAMAHEASGERDKALNLFEDLYGQDASFRDVAQKVRELRAQS